MESPTPVLSVIIPIYNGEVYLHQCIDSVLNQELSNIEIILVDDGSEDSTPVICDTYADTDSRVKVIHQSNQGLLQSRINGTQAAAAEYVIFVDADDYIATNHLSSLWEIVEKENVDLVAGSYISFFKSQTILKKSIFSGYYGCDCMEQCISEYLSAYLTPCHFCNIWGKIIKKASLIRAFALVDSKVAMGEDIITSLALFTQIQNMYVKDDLYTYFYRVHNGSMCQSYREDLLADSKRMLLSLQSISLPEKCEEIRRNILFEYARKKIRGNIANQHYLGFKNLYKRAQQLSNALHRDEFWSQFLHCKIAWSDFHKADILYWCLARNHLILYCILFVPYYLVQKIRHKYIE